MVRMTYHEKVKELRPYLVIQFTSFHAYNIDRIIIKGIGRKYWGSDMFGCLQYELPYHGKGLPYFFVIVIVYECIINTIVVLLFIINSKPIQNSDHKTVMGSVFISA